MKAYMAYDRQGGSEEAACLVFAATVKMARALAFPILISWHDTEWIDCAARLIRDLPQHLAILDTGKKQVIESPPTCEICGQWGGDKLIDGWCENCYEEDKY